MWETEREWKWRINQDWRERTRERCISSESIFFYSGWVLTLGPGAALWTWRIPILSSRNWFFFFFFFDNFLLHFYLAIFLLLLFFFNLSSLPFSLLILSPVSTRTFPAVREPSRRLTDFPENFFPPPFAFNRCENWKILFPALKQQRIKSMRIYEPFRAQCEALKSYLLLEGGMMENKMR